MKTSFVNILKGLSLVLLVSACGTTTSITSSWRKPNATANGYHHIFVAALTNNVPAKHAVETSIQAELEQKGLKVEKSIDVFPPDFNQSSQQKDLLLGKINSTNADAILTVTVLKEREQSRFVPTGPYWNPGGRYGYYNNFWNYYNYRYPTIYSQGYYDVTQIYYLETNLYDAKTQELLWAAQSKTYDPSSIDSFVKGYIKAISERMMKDGLISSDSGLATPK